jgi:hypothetical protein
MQAYNVAGVVYSESVSFVLASTPTAPSHAPKSDLLVSSAQQLKIDYQNLADNGGSVLLAFQLEIDDGLGGPFEPIYTGLALSFIQTPVMRSLQYRVRYMAMNVNGWSDYSPVGYMLAAQVPSKPDQVEFLTATAFAIQVNVPRIVDNGGAIVQRYELWIDDGNKGVYSEVTSYDQSTTFEIDSALETQLVSGLIYRIKFRGVNVIGSGEFSEVIEVAMVSLPQVPDSPTKVLQLSSATSITVRWDAPFVAVTELLGGRILFYQLFVDDGMFGDYQMIQETKSTQRQFTVTGLTTGAAYRFKVVAHNFNGQGLESASSIHYSCATPSGLSPPQLVQTTQQYMTLSW